MKKTKRSNMNKYSVMGYSLNFPKSFEYDKNNLPYVKLDADLNNGKTFSYLNPKQSQIVAFENKNAVLEWAQKNLQICNFFSINKIANEDCHYNFLTSSKITKSEFNFKE